MAVTSKSRIPDPQSRSIRLFSQLRESLPAFKQKAWQRILKNPQFIAVAHAVFSGKKTAIDLDHTLYKTDATYALIHLGHFLDIFPQANRQTFARAYQRYYSPKNAAASKSQKYEAERRFYCSIVQLFSGMRFSDTKTLAQRLWFEGYAGFAVERPLFHYVYPEMAYLVALGMEGNAQGINFSFVTASPNFSIWPLAHFFGLRLSNVASFDPLLRGDLITNKIDRMTFGAGKVTAVRKIFGALPDISIGDSPTNDWALLTKARLYSMGVGEKMAALNGVSLRKNHRLLHVPFAPVKHATTLFDAPPKNLF